MECRTFCLRARAAEARTSLFRTRTTTTLGACHIHPGILTTLSCTCHQVLIIRHQVLNSVITVLRHSIYFVVISTFSCRPIIKSTTLARTQAPATSAATAVMTFHLDRNHTDCNSDSLVDCFQSRCRFHSLGLVLGGAFDPANWPNVAPCRRSSQWSSPCEGNNKEVGFGV